MAMAASVSAVDLSQIAALVGNHFRYENSHWESIGRRWLMLDLIPGSENKKIYRSRFALVKKFELCRQV